jgi:hypothetical protein
MDDEILQTPGRTVRRTPEDLLTELAQHREDAAKLRVESLYDVIGHHSKLRQTSSTTTLS